METKTLEKVIANPIPFAHALGYNKLTEEIHKDWVTKMFHLKEHGTLQAHRGSYKTTCLIIALALRAIAKPAENIILLRKSQEDVKEVFSAVSKALHNPISQCLIKEVYGNYPIFRMDNSTEIELSTYKGAMGAQLLGLGLNSSITGKHGPVVTDDIVTLKDRLSEAARKQTKSQYMELINIASEENHRIFNTGTPWHKDDAFSLMPPPDKYDVYSTGIISKERALERKNNMSSSLYAANYELKHIADGDLLFLEPKYGAFPIGINCFAHIDAGYGGEDGTALTIIGEKDDQLHTIGWLMQGHVETHYKEIISRLERFQVHQCACEDNADKGYLRKELKKLTNIPFYGYHEKTNKYYKISSYGKGAWKRAIIDIDQSDLEYVSQIMDYNENASHDDSPDSFSSIVRWKFARSRKMSGGDLS